MALSLPAVNPAYWRPRASTTVGWRDRLLLLRPDRRLRGGEARDGYTEGRAGHVVEPGRVEEGDRCRVAAVLAADADLEIGPHPAAALGADPHQLAHAVGIDGDERIDLENAALRVVGENRCGIVARQPQAGLRQIVGAEREELGARLAVRDLVGLER